MKIEAARMIMWTTINDSLTHLPWLAWDCTWLRGLRRRSWRGGGVMAAAGVSSWAVSGEYWPVLLLSYTTMLIWGVCVENYIRTSCHDAFTSFFLGSQENNVHIKEKNNSTTVAQNFLSLLLCTLHTEYTEYTLHSIQVNYFPNVYLLFLNKINKTVLQLPAIYVMIPIHLKIRHCIRHELWWSYLELRVSPNIVTLKLYSASSERGENSPLITIAIGGYRVSLCL